MTERYAANVDIDVDDQRQQNEQSLQLQLLGHLSITRAGRPLVFKRRKSAALLVYLLLTR